MPRGPRKKSVYGYYHMTARGISGQDIFEERADYIRYLHLLKRFGEETDVKICAYCLMGNHIHLLVYDKNDNISRFAQKLTGTYAMYFNTKYNRPGYLFQGRFGSVPIESDIQLLRTFRYILNNPEEGGICPKDRYEWSSYSKYGNPASFVDTTVLVEMLGSFEDYRAFLDSVEDEPEKRTAVFAHNDEWAKSVIREVLNGENGMVLKSYDAEKRDEILRMLKAKGLSIRQIARLTGISKSVIQRA